VCPGGDLLFCGLFGQGGLNLPGLFQDVGLGFFPGGVLSEFVKQVGYGE